MRNLWRVVVVVVGHRPRMSEGLLLAGVDEVGRGCLFGPVVAAAVLVHPETLTALVSLGVKDSKQLSAHQRQTLVPLIQGAVLGYGIGLATVTEIEQLNIRRASLLAMKRALWKLPHSPDRCLIDGRDRIPDLPWEQETVIRGDQSSPAIAAASILGKVWRDELLQRLARKYPDYDLANNKGYGTAKHRQALQQFGLTRFHRPLFCRKSLSSGAFTESAPD